MQPTPLDDKVVLASYPQYRDAQAAVDRLSDAKFPVQETSIVGRDLRLVETVTGRLNYGRAALSGLASGAWFGLLVGLFVAIFAADDTASWIALVLWGLLFGAIAGVVFSVVAYSATGGRRDFVSVSSLVAAQYDVLVGARAADDARRLLGLAGQPGPPPGGSGTPWNPDSPAQPQYRPHGQP